MHRNQWPIVFLVAMALLFGAARSLLATGDFDRPNTYIGNADWAGGLVLWVEIAEVPLGDGTALPLRMRFTSKTQEALFGGHWWCPLEMKDAAGVLLGWVMMYPDGRKDEMRLENGLDGVTQMTSSDGARFRWTAESGVLISDSYFSYKNVVVFDGGWARRPGASLVAKVPEKAWSEKS